MQPTRRQFYVFLATVAVYIITFIASFDPLRFGKVWNCNMSRNLRDYVVNGSLPLIPAHFGRAENLLLIMITSPPDHFAERQAIRSTWAKRQFLKNLSIEVYFMLGKTDIERVQNTILMEQIYFKDIIQGNFIDNYCNLTLKTFFMLKVFNSFLKSRFLLKADEDVLINTHRLKRWLSRNKNTINLLTGRLLNKAKPNRNYKRKWYCPRYMYDEIYYPNFTAGPAYLMSRDVTEKLYRSALTLPLFHLEDVFFTGICARHAGVDPTNNRMIINLQYYYNLNSSEYSTMFALHGINPLELLNLNCSFDPLKCT